ncbi:MAG TPA: formyltetrahydrofolate deformylase [Candidatus Acidoferrum sp.]|jgi:formyltetrahydrofolate deformylase|nr:formyltetrahydrofolate deformylase [Candidatus Acidoferrum sp.]
MKQFATITVIGRDKTGVVARVTNFLFEQRANIEALEEQVTRGQFSMTLQASWPKKNFNAAALRTGLDQLALALGMEIKTRFTETGRRQRFAIFVTKEPRCFETIARAAAKKSLKADPALVVGNHASFASLAKKYRLPFVYLPWENRAGAELKALKLLEEHEIDFVVLARFMKILSPNFVWRHKNKIINIHPSLLPSFPGPQAYRQAYERGVKVAGCTAHFVNMHLDDGPIIAQGSFQIRPGMTLPQIVETGQKLEAKVLLKAVKSYLTNRLDVYWGTVNQV